MKRFLPLLLFVCSVGWAVNTDPFTYSNGSLETVSSGVWESRTGNMQVSSNHIYPGSWEPPCCFGVLYRWTSNTFTADQYAELELTAYTSVSAMLGPAVRVSDSATTGYYYNSSSGSRRLQKVVAGTVTAIAQFDTPSLGVYRLEAEGTTLTPYIDDILDSDIGAQTDASIASGWAGIMGHDLRDTHTADNWEGGDLGAPPTSTPTATLTFTPTPTFTATPTFTPTLTLTPTPAGVARVFESKIFAGQNWRDAIR